MRSEWSYGVATAIQHAIGETLEADPHELATACRRLVERLPQPDNVPEWMELRSRLCEFALRSGDSFHRRHHGGTRSTCLFAPIEETAPLWFDSVRDPRPLLLEWVAQYISRFDRYHPAPALKFARLLRDAGPERSTLPDIARKLGTSLSALRRSVVATFGMSPSEYGTRVRLHKAVTILRGSPAKVCEAARLTGYRSVKNLNRALMKYTGLKPSPVRRLSAAEIDALYTTVSGHGTLENRDHKRQRAHARSVSHQR